MGLTNSSIGKKAVDSGLEIKRQSPRDRVIALAGNPNVGKSSVFNALTGMHQHTGNWAGKTVALAQGRFTTEKNDYVLVDLPGTYSLMAHSAEEEVARDFICFGEPDAVVVVCDATCLSRGLNLVLQTMEISDKVIVCVNLMDEAERRGISLDLSLISERLGVPVVGVSARQKRSLDALCDALDNLNSGNAKKSRRIVSYQDNIERSIADLEDILTKQLDNKVKHRWLSLKLLEGDKPLLEQADKFLGGQLMTYEPLIAAVEREKQRLSERGIDMDALKDSVVSSLIKTAEGICTGAVTYANAEKRHRDLRIDRVLTGRLAGYPVMLALLAVIFWLTISGANYPSELLSKILFWVQDKLSAFLTYLGAPEWLRGLLADGAFRVLAWVVSVMLPPMAIFFPLFTLLEDSGYLPRVAYNLDTPFKRCKACGKQALTM